jgi:hypothetical protein
MSEQNQLTTVNTSSVGLTMSPESMSSMLEVARLMATSKVTVPKHLQGSPADCMAVTMQAMQWGMNPFAVAQKTHVTQSGALGYEAQLIAAVICANAPVLESAPVYEYIGDWSKVLGKVESKTSEKGGKYFVATYSKADEAGLGVICRMTLKGEPEPREITLMMSQCYPRFSTQWATDPKQQISYAAIRKWARLFSPGTILGVYTPDELEEIPVQSKNMGAVEVVETEEYQQYEQNFLPALKLSAQMGLNHLQNTFSTLEKSPFKVQLWQKHSDGLKATAAEADEKRTVESEPTPAKEPAIVDDEFVKGMGE